MKKIIIIVSTLILVAAIAIPLALPAFAKDGDEEINVMGSSPISWEDAAKSAIEETSKTYRISSAKVEKLNVLVGDGKITQYQAYLEITLEE